MGQRVQDISSDEIIDEKKILKEAEEREKEAKAEAKKEKAEAKKIEKRKKKTKLEVKKQIRKRPKHGRKYRSALKGLDKSKKYELPEAIKLLKSQKIESFDATVLLTVSLDKRAENVRGSVNLPGGAVKERKIEIVDEKNVEEMIKKIKEGKYDFDILVAKTSVMPKLGQVAKVLGPKGLMPNPKSGTVAEDPEKAAEDFRDGKVEFKADKGNNVHVPVAKSSFDDKKIEDNIQAVISALPAGNIRSVYLSRSMGPSVKLAF